MSPLCQVRSDPADGVGMGVAADFQNFLSSCRDFRHILGVPISAATSVAAGKDRPESVITGAEVYCNILI